MFTLKAPAKINLFLEVINKREDGYHNLQTIMQTVSLFDELTFKENENDIILQSNNKSLPNDDTNIIVKAAKMLKKRFNIQKGAKIFLDKKIPMGAGLGGGSSDAATTLKGLVKLWNIKIENKELIEISSKLGADVAFFINGGTALCEAIGDRITQLKPIEKMPILLVNPKIIVPTVSVFKKIKFPLTKQMKINTITQLINRGSFNKETAIESCYNRLEEFTFQDYPEIVKVKETLANLGFYSIMSGSGATVFSILGNECQFVNVSVLLQELHWDTWLVYPVC